MEKQDDFSIDDKGKGNYIIRTSGTFLPEEYIEQNPQLKDPLSNGDSYVEYVSQAMMLVAENLEDQSKDKKIDSVGIWVTFDDDDKVDSSMDLATMQMMKEHHEDLDPYFEFTKMTIQPFYESEAS